MFMFMFKPKSMSKFKFKTYSKLIVSRQCNCQLLTANC